MRDLNKTKPRGRADDGLIAELARFESTLMVAKEDRVRGVAVARHYTDADLFKQNAARSKLQGIKDELKHIDAEMIKIKPELQEVFGQFPLYLLDF